ncbi:MAG: PspA/IM30 family protein [Gaiellales bacterium]
MAGLMSRFTTLFKVKANKALDRAEDPGETLDYSYTKQLEMLQKVKRGVADVVTSKKRLQLQTAKLEESIVKLDGQARQALAANREDLARTALERKSLIQGQLQGMDAQITQLEQQQQSLIDQERRLSAKVESFRTQKEVVKAQYSAAEAQVRIGEATTGLGEEMSDVGLALSRAQDKTEQMQARAAAVTELVDTGAIDDLTAPAGSDLDQQIAALTSGNQVDAELAKLKAALGTGGAAGEIEAGTAAPETAPEAAPAEEAKP